MILTERQIERTIRDLLEADGWRTFKMEKQFSEKKRKSIGELGMADLLCVRYPPFDQITCRSKVDGSGVAVKGPLDCRPSRELGVCEAFWLENKRIDKRGRTTKAKPHQNDWHTLERKRGALTLIAGQDFPASIEGFTEFYLASGLNRRIVR